MKLKCMGIICGLIKYLYEKKKSFFFLFIMTPETIETKYFIGY